jgi:uncharacterized protein (DUF2236 family)
MTSSTGLPLSLGPIDPIISDVRRRLQSVLIRTLAGTDPEPRTPAPDSWFGADSVTHRLHQDPSMLLGGVRALMLQTMQPRTMAGVAQHSDYKHDPLGRLWRTGAYVGAVTFGSDAEAKAAIRMVNRAHRPVHGVTAEGERYDANDPDLKLWVHVAMIDSFLTANRRYGSQPLRAGEADAYIVEQGIVARALKTAPMPTSVAEMRDYFADLRRTGEMRATPEARDTVRWLLGVKVSVATRAPYALIAGAAMNTLPAWVRLQLRLPILPVSDRLAVRPATTAVLRTFGWALSAPLSAAPASSSPSASAST